MKRIFLVLILGLLVVSSCKKEEKEPVTLEFLQGTWAGDTIEMYQGFNANIWGTFQVDDDSIRLFSRSITDAYDTCYQWNPNDPLYEQSHLSGLLTLNGFQFNINGDLYKTTNLSPTECDEVKPFNTYGEIYEEGGNVFLTVKKGAFLLNQYKVERE